MRFVRQLVVLCLAVQFLITGSLANAQPFSDLVGDVRVGSVKNTDTIEVPFITWGGDVATFYANGGVTTSSDSIYGKLGLKLKLVNGDDFIEQVRRYRQGDTPFLRGTLRMIGQASEVLGSDPRTKPVVFMQLTWSAGDHIVSREGLTRLEQLKGSKVALQQGGPHVGMLDDALRVAQLTWDDIEVVWVDDLSGPNGPAELMRKDKSIDACCVITPDMIGLTGGLEQTGSGAEGTIKGAHVLISTAQMSRSIADVYAVRKDYFDANRELVEKFVAGYFKGAEQLVAMRNKFEETGSADGYMDTLKLAQQILGEEVLPTLEVDAHGLLLDCTFVGLPGNISFYEDEGNLSGFEAKQRAALDLAVSLGYAKQRAGFFGPSFDYNKIAKLGGLERVTGSGQGRILAETVEDFPDLAKGDENVIVAFTISFEPNQDEFSADVYGPEFRRAVESASTFGNAVIAIRGHSDPTRTLSDLVKAGLSKGILKRSGSSGNWQYYFNQRPLDLTDTQKIVDLIESGAFDGDSNNPRETMQAALNLSRARAVAVRDAIVTFAKAQGLTLDASQIQPVGVGVSEPLIAKPTNLNEAKQNMRVEFRLIKVPAEAVRPSDFDF